MAKRKHRSGATLLDAPPSPPVRPGVVSPRRTVPAAIARPEYATSGEPGPRRSREVRTPDEIDAMRIAGRVAAEILIEVGEAVRPGVTTDELDRVCHEATIARGAYPSPLNYRGYPKSLCTSVNEIICHGIPDSRRLAEGDIVNLDVTAFIEGVHGDTSATFLVGEVDEASKSLVRETRASLHAGIAQVQPGNHVYDIGRAIEAQVAPFRFGIVREFVGHGISDEFHSSLQIPHYFDKRNKVEFAPGMTFTIEPMITIGPPDLYVWDDDWTAATLSGQRTAQFEHTLLVTDDGVEILTLPAEGEPAERRIGI